MSNFFFSDSDDDSESDDLPTRSSSLNEDTFYQKKMTDAKHFAAIFEIHPDVALLCLLIDNWNNDKFSTEFIQNKSQYLQKLGLKESDINKPQGMHQYNGNETITCGVCFEDSKPEAMIALPCDHYFCMECWKNHIYTSVNSGSNIITCMEHKCPHIILPPDIEKLCGKEISDTLQARMASSIVGMSSTARRCVNPKCTKIFTVDEVGLCDVVKCKCGTRTCWLCGNKSHAPATCEQSEKWLMDYSNDLEKIWLSKNTKKCPNCKADIEKDGGCNHMTCNGCKYEFCWICGHEWKTHTGNAYECNTYKSWNNEKVDDFERLDHYLNRYVEHENSHINEIKNREKYREKIEKFNRQSIEFQAINDINHIIGVVDEARSVLKWSYVYAFFLPPDSQELKLFEFVQKQCEIAIDQISYSLETTIRINFAKKWKTLEKEMTALLKHVDDHTKTVAT